MARSASKPRPSKPSPRKRKVNGTKKGGPVALPDPQQWYKLGDWPFPVQIAATLKAEGTGEVVGVGVYVRVPIPWDEWLTPIPPLSTPDPPKE